MNDPIEILEARIAPAVLLPGGKGITYTDVDGDQVTVTLSKGQLSEADFTFDTPFSSTGPQQLQLLNLSDDGQEFANSNITVSAKPVNGAGNGFANVGFISAKGVDLASIRVVGDLGRIEAGDDDETIIGIKTLSVQSMGLFGTSTQAANGTLRSFAYGGIGALKIAGDFRQAEFNTAVAGMDKTPDIGSITIGGSVIGGANTFSGQIYSVGKIGPVKIGGDLRGGSAASTGQISAGSTIASVTIGGDVVGGTYDSPVATADSGAIISGRDIGVSGDVGSIKIGGSLIGGVGERGGHISVGLNSPGKLGSLIVKDDIVGSIGESSAVVSVNGLLEKLQVGGDLNGGSGALSGAIMVTSFGSGNLKGNVQGDGSGSARIVSTATGKFAVGGSIIGGAGFQSGILALGATGSLNVGGSIEVGASSGGFVSFLNVESVMVKGSLVGGPMADQFGILVTSTAGAITIGGDIRTGEGGGRVNGIFVGEHVETLLIRGSVLVADSANSGTTLFIGSAESIRILGDVRGDADSPAVFRISGAAKFQVDLGALTVGGNFEQVNLIGGGGVVDGIEFGRIVIGKDFIASRIAVSTTAGGDGIFGTDDDTFLNQTGMISRLASLVVKGQAYGTGGGNDSYQILAEVIGKVQVKGVTLSLANSTVPLGPTGDLDVRYAK